MRHLAVDPLEPRPTPWDLAPLAHLREDPMILAGEGPVGRELKERERGWDNRAWTVSRAETNPVVCAWRAR